MALDVPANVAELYDARGDEVSLARPLLQGDVLTDVVLPGLSDKPREVMITSHPCSMRRGASLEEFVTVAPVDTRAQPIPLHKWANSFVYAFPLPELDYAPAPPRYADFRLMTAVRSQLLDRSRRFACLSEYGLQLLMQRQVYFFTRVEVDLPSIRHVLAPVFAEVELCQEWVEAAIGDIDDPHHDRIEDAERDYQEFLGDGRSEMRERLRDAQRRSGVRREVRRAIRSKFGRPGGDAL